MDTPTQGTDPTPPPADEHDASLFDVVLVLATHLRLLTIGPLAAGLCALGISFLIPPTYTAKTVLLPPQQPQSAATAALQNLGALAGLAGGAGARSPVDQYVALMQSSTVENRLIERFNLMAVYDAKFLSDARSELERNTRISAGRKDGLLTVEVDDRDPKRAADIANSYVDELRNITSLLAVTEAQQRRTFFEKQLAQTKERLAIAQRALQAAGINEGAIRAEPKAAAEAYARVQAEVTAAEVRVQTMRGYLAETSAEFKQAQNQLAALREQLAKREAVSVAGARDVYVDRFREFKYQETLFDLFARQYEIARIDESREGALIQVVDEATAPDRKSKPKRTLLVIASSVSAAVLLLLWVLVRGLWRMAALDRRTSGRVTQLRALLRLNLTNKR